MARGHISERRAHGKHVQITNIGAPADRRSCPSNLLRSLQLSRGCHGRALPIQEAIAAKYRTALGGPERNRCFPSALRTVGHRFDPMIPRGRGPLAFALTRLATFGFVLEILIVVEMLLPSGKNEVRPTV